LYVRLLGTVEQQELIARPGTMTPQELKKALISAGFEVYRTNGEEIILADRVRDNLILDSGVRVKASTPLQIRLIMGIRRAHYPTDDEQTLFNRIRQLATPLLDEGFAEADTHVAPVADPADSSVTLDTFYEVIYMKEVAKVDDTSLRLALQVATMAQSRH
jgi:hypothetical protein